MTLPDESNDQPSPSTQEADDNRLFTHGPPIIIDDGSLKIEVPVELDTNTAGTILTHRRVLKHSSDNELNYNNIAWIEVTTLSSTQEVKRVPRSGQLADGHKLKIHFDLVPETGTAGPPVFSLIVLSGSLYAIETNHILGEKEPTGGTSRPFRHRHPAIAGIKTFHIGKWELLTRTNGSVNNGSGVRTPSTESIRILVTFKHP